MQYLSFLIQRILLNVVSSSRIRVETMVEFHSFPKRRDAPEYTPHGLYPSICGGAPWLIPVLGRCEECGRKLVTVSFCCWIWTRWFDCWPFDSWCPQWPHYRTSPPAHRCSPFAAASLASLTLCVLYFSLSDRSVLLPHCGFDLHFPNVERFFFNMCWPVVFLPCELSVDYLPISLLLRFIYYYCFLKTVIFIGKADL